MTSENLLFPLARILSLPDDGRPVFLRQGELVWGQRRFRLDSASSSARTTYLLQRIGLGSLRPEKLAENWGRLLAGEHPRSHHELLDAVRRSGDSGLGGNGSLRRWRAALEPMLEELPAAAGAVEFFGAHVPEEELALRLELRPLLETWPRRLLHDPWWATAESPLPSMSPLPLDEVWVDLQMLDSGEWSAIAGLESLRTLLDQRYEERRWRSEPLALVLERLNGIVALVGSPGSGKTTLLKWIARRLVQEPGSRYLLPLFVPLRRYIFRRRDGGEAGLLRFALHECGVERSEQKSLWIQVLNELAGTWRERVLVMLDGWDEVPVEDRDSLLQELRDLSYGFSVLVTSRPAAFPSRLTASRVYEVADLAPDGIDSLIHRWFRGVGEPDQAEALLHHLERHPDLRRLARNPFLLTLLCGISREAHRRSGLHLPATRAALYEQTLELIYSHHDERYPEAAIGSDRQRQIERLALWLLDEAPGAPRFVFGAQDVAASGGDPDLLPRVLRPSRLLCQLGLDESHHFLHATFQEYLAANALARKPPGSALQRLRKHLHDAAWQEVFHFLASQPGSLRDAFWHEMAAQARHPDRFGIVLARLARWVAATGARDGGVALLGLDLRDLLWPHIETLSASRLWVEAYAEVDTPGLVRRLETSIRDAGPRLRARLQRALTRVRNPAASRALVEQILGDDPHQAAVAGTQLRLRIDRAGLERLREAVGDSGQSDAVRQQAIRALGYSRDSTSVPLLVRIVESVQSLAGEVACALGRIGGRDAINTLAAMLELPRRDVQRTATLALGDMRDAAARDVLLDEIARRQEADPLIVPLLDALAEIPIHRGSEVIAELLTSEDSEVRRAAAWALAEATGPGVFEALVKAAGDQEEGVRCAALEVLHERARPDDANWLLARISDATRSSEERGLALRALLGVAGRHANGPEGQWLPGVAVEQVLLALRDPEGDLALEAVDHAHHAGPSVGPRLIQLCLDEEASPSVREGACTALGRMEYRGAASALLNLVRAAPDADDDEDQPLEKGRHRIARAAAEALARIDAGLLLQEPGTTAYFALARFAVETGALIYDRRIVGPDGREWARVDIPKKQARAVKQAQGFGTVRFAESDVKAVDLEIHVAVRTVEGQKVLRYTLTSPSGTVRLTHQVVDSDPLREPGAYRERLVRRIENLQLRKDFDEAPLTQTEVAEQLTKIGQELFRKLFPSVMRFMYREWRENVRTIQINCEEPWIPWELLRPFDGDFKPVIDDDFLGAQFELTRWQTGHSAPAAAIRVVRLACVEAGQSPTGSALPAASQELDLLADFAGRHQGVEDVSLPSATFPAFDQLLSQGGLNLLHFVGHGEFSMLAPEDSKILLTDGRNLRAGDLQGPLQGQIREDRPLVFFNACDTARQGWALTGLGGWTEAWVNRCGVGAFVAPQWRVNDELAYEFARLFYLALESGRPLGRSARLARRWVRRKDRSDPTWLGYSVYGHPNARVSFGSEVLPEPGGKSERGNARKDRNRKSLIETLRGNSDRVRAGLEPYLLPRISRREVHEKYLPAIRESIYGERSRIIPILGSAGYGKSTLLGEIYDVLRSEDQPWIALVDCAEISGSTPEALSFHLGRLVGDSEVPFEHLARELGRTAGVLLIDTLDLLLSPALVPHLQRLFFELRASATTVVFTCRDVDYQALLEPPGLRLPQVAGRIDRYNVPPFTPAEVILAARAFVDGRPRLRESGRGDVFLDRLRSLSADSRPLQSITANPLLLAMLCEVFGEEGDLPRDLTVSELYERHWDEKVARSRTRGSGDPVVMEKPRLCLRVAQHLLEDWHSSVHDWIAEPDLGLEGSSAVAQAWAELLSDGILKRVSGGRVRFFHQTFLEYVMARWLTTGSGSSGLESVVNSVRAEPIGVLHWWPVLRLLLVMVEPDRFDAIVEQLPVENLAGFRTLSFATVARSDAARWRRLLDRSLVLGPSYQKELIAALESAPARFVDPAWATLEALLGSASRDVAVAATTAVGALLVRNKDAIASHLRSMLDTLRERAQRTGAVEECGEILGQLLRACLPALKDTGDPEVFDLLRARYADFSSRGRGLIVDVFRTAKFEPRQRAEFVRFLFTRPRHKHLPVESLISLIRDVLRDEIPSEGLTLEEKLELLYRPVPSAWASFHARAVAHLFPDDDLLLGGVLGNVLSSQPRSPSCSVAFLGEVSRLGLADRVCRALVSLPSASVPAGRLTSLMPVFRGLARDEQIDVHIDVANWLLPLAVDRPREALAAFSIVAESSTETWNQFLVLLQGAIERGDESLAQRVVEGLPERALKRLAPEILLAVGRRPKSSGLLQILIAVSAPRAGASEEARSALVEMSLSPARRVALAASLALAQAARQGAAIRVSELLPLVESDFPGVRDHMLEAVMWNQQASGDFREDELVALCEKLVGETNAPTLQKACEIVGTWVRREGRVPEPVARWASDLAKRVGPGRMEKGVAGSLARTLKNMAQLEDPRLAAPLQAAAQAMLRDVRHPNQLRFGESELTDLVSALARIDTLFLARLVDDGPSLEPRNIRGLAEAIRRVEGPRSPLIARILDSDWCPPQARAAILKFSGV